MLPFKKITLLLFSIMILGGFQCDDEPVPTYDFDMSIQVTPDDKEISLGDTLWLSGSVPDRIMYDSKSNQNVSVENALINLELQVDGGDAPFEFITHEIADTLSFIENNTIHFEYGCQWSADDYRFKLGILPSEKGVFSLKPSWRSEVLVGGSIPCDSIWNYNRYSIPYGTLEYLFNMADPHLDLYYETTDISNMENLTMGKKAYWFRVK